MITVSDISRQDIEDVKQKFLALTGLRSAECQIEQVGLEQFLRFAVGQEAPLYRHVLGTINNELPPDHQLKSRLTLLVDRGGKVLESPEVEMLRALITRSLRVTSEQLVESYRVKFAPFRGGEEAIITQPANHVIQGRRGVGKSSLILMGVERIRAENNMPVWIDMQVYRGRDEPKVAMEVVNEVFRLLTDEETPALPELDRIRDQIEQFLASKDGGEAELRTFLPRCRDVVRIWTRTTKKRLFVFLDDAHLLAPGIQPFVFDTIYSILKAAGGWIKVAGVKTLLRLYEPQSHKGLEIPHDAQIIDLDLNLVNPAAAKEYLESILNQFIKPCGFTHANAFLPSQARERLVWCSAGVPRDFLWLLERAIGNAQNYRRLKVGVQDVNLAIGEFSQTKLQELDLDTNQEESARVK
ncbi:MAG: hypothetical protein ACREBU_10925, partial [Nitrososphaera sp.]